MTASRRCDCKEQLDLALETVHAQGGAVIYLPQEGRGIGLANKIAGAPPAPAATLAAGVAPSALRPW